MYFQISISTNHHKYHVLFHVQKQIKLWTGMTQQISWCPRHPGAFRWVSRLKSENPIGKYEVFFEQVLDNLELSEPLDLAFILIQVFYSSSACPFSVTQDWKLYDIFSARLLLHCAYGLHSHLQVVLNINIYQWFLSLWFTESVYFFSHSGFE